MKHVAACADAQGMSGCIFRKVVNLTILVGHASHRRGLVDGLLTNAAGIKGQLTTPGTEQMELGQGHLGGHGLRMNKWRDVCMPPG